MQASIVFVAVPDRLRNALLGPTLEAGFTWRTHEPHTATKLPKDVDVVVIGPEAPDPVDEAQRWFRSDRSLAILILVDPETRARVEADLLTAPYVGKTVRITSPQDVEAFADIVDVARRHKKVRRQLSQANRLLDRVNELI